MATLTSGYSATSTGTSSVAKVWVKDPLDPTKNTNVAYHADKKITIKKNRQRTVLRPLGRTLPVVVSGGSKGDSFLLRLWTEGDAPYIALMAAIDTTRTLLVQTPKDQWYVQLGGDIELEEDEWSLGQATIRSVAVQVVEVDVP